MFKVSNKECYTYDIHENYPILKTPHLPPSLSKDPPPPPNDNESVKGKHNLKMTITCYQIIPSGRLLLSRHH